MSGRRIASNEYWRECVFCGRPTKGNAATASHRDACEKRTPDQRQAALDKWIAKENRAIERRGWGKKRVGWTVRGATPTGAGEDAQMWSVRELLKHQGTP